MSMSPESNSQHPWPYPSHDSPDVARWQSRLPPLLSALAGMVDVLGFLSLGKLFTAHVTGNLVVIAALLVRGGPLNMAQLLAVPVFIGAVGAVWLLAKAFDRRGPALARPLLLVQCLLLTCVLLCSVISDPAAHPHGLMAGAAAMIAVAAIACQFTLLRLAVPGAPSTAVMTGNVTTTVLSLLDMLSRSEPLMEGANERLKKTVELVVGFFAGCIAGAAAVSWLREWAWSLPVVLAGVAVALVPGRMGSIRVMSGR